MSEELPRALSQSEMEMIEARMAQRNEHLAEKCSEFGLDVHGKVILIFVPFVYFDFFLRSFRFAIKFCQSLYTNIYRE